MSITCTGCEAENPDDARFCNRCGTRLDRVDAGQGNTTFELRQVTVLFCDLVASTELSNALDYEDLVKVFSAFRSIVRDIARSHSGYRLRFVGDGARVIFGHPHTREDANESAVRCGLELAAAMRASRCISQSLELRVGIAFGTAALGDAIEETASGAEAVVGTVAHLAARLMAVAPPGGVVVDHSTRKLVGGFFDCQDLGPLRLKGFEQRVRCWLVLRETRVESRHKARRTWVRDNRLIGRDTEVARLQALWRLATSGQGRSVIFVGEPGVGKSRLAHALDDVAREAGATCLEYQCTPRTQNTPLFPVRVLARNLSGIEPFDGDEAALEKGRRLLTQSIGTKADSAMPYLRSLFTASGTAVGIPGESPELVRERTNGFILEVVYALAARGPVLIRFEDLQWSDPTTAMLLRRLVSESCKYPILTIVTARPESDLAASELPHVTTMQLAPLGEVESRALIEQLAEGERLAPSIVDSIIARGEGVPLYLEELTRSVLDASERDESDSVQEPTAPEIPATLRNVIQGRLDRQPWLLGTTKAAAVMGRELSLQLLCDVLGSSQAEVRNAIARLVDDGILVMPDARHPDSVQFKHALIQEAVYLTLLRSERERLHSRTSDVLLSHAGGASYGSPDVIAYHLSAARRFEDAVRCLIAASADNIANAAYMEAVGHCRVGLKHVEHLEDAITRGALRRQLLTQIGLGLSATRGYAAPEVEEAYREARALCDDHSDPATLYPTIRGLSTYHLVRGDLAVNHEISLQCLALSERAGLPELNIDALCVHAYATYYYGSLAESRTALERCLALYRAEGGERFTYPTPQDAATASWALLPTVAWLMGDAEAAEAAFTAGLEHVERLGRPFDAALLHAWFAGARYTQRRYTLAAEHARKSAAVSKKFGYDNWLATSTILLRLVEAALDPAPEALAEARQLCAGFDAAGIGLNASYYLLGIARGLARMNDIAGAREAIAHAFRRANGSGESRNVPELMIFQADLEPDDDIALSSLEGALALAREQGAVTSALRAALALLKRSGRGLRGESAEEVALRLHGDAPLPAHFLRDKLQIALEALGDAPVAAA